MVRALHARHRSDLTKKDTVETFSDAVAKYPFPRSPFPPKEPNYPNNLYNPA